LKPVRRVLFAASEAVPFIKTGGLADVAGALPLALRKAGLDVQLCLPAYREVRAAAGPLRVAARLRLPGLPGEVLIARARTTDLPVWLVDYGPAFDRDGHPYLDASGHDYPDNAERFALFGRAVAALAAGEAGLDWQPDIVHCNDWQTGLVPALLSGRMRRPATVFTIHNLAYQGLFDGAYIERLDLPRGLWQMHGLEFFGRVSFIKGGLVFADRLTTVSPSYAREICTPDYGCGLDGLLRERAGSLVGILNGADYDCWNPSTDPLIARHFDARHLADKRHNGAQLREASGLPDAPGRPLVGLIGRMVDQKGVDLVHAALPRILATGAQLVVLGTGEARYERAWREAAAQWPGQVAVTIGYDESLAHRIEAGADMFLMPSRFEPCGLNQIYSLRYGTLPLVRRTGGLADTVVDPGDAGAATGFVFDAPQPGALADCFERACDTFARPRLWQTMMRNAMRQDYSWDASAGQYVALYESALAGRP